MRTRLIRFGVATTFALALPAPAGAAVVARGHQIGGAAPFGEGIAYGEYTTTAVRLWERRPGERPRRLTSFSRAGSPLWAVSSSILVVQRRPERGSDESAGAGFELSAGAPAGPLTLVTSCPPGAGTPDQWSGAPEPVADGSLAAATGGDCRNDRAIVLGPGGPPRVLAAGGRIAGLSLEGRWLAAAVVAPAGATQIVVWDAASGLESHRVAVPASVLTVTFDIQADGITAIGYGLGRACRSAWASPAEPFLHETGRGRCNVAALSGGSLLRIVEESRVAELHLSDLMATSPRVIGRAATVLGAAMSPDEIVWVQWRCTDHAVHLRAISDLAAPDPAASCRAVVAGGPLLMSRSGLVRVPVTCPEGCRDATLALIRCSHRSCGDAMRFGVGRRGRRTLSFRANRRACRLIARSPRKVLVKTGSPPGAQRLASRTVRLAPRSGRRSRLCTAASR